MLSTRAAAATVSHGPLVTIPPDATLRDAARLLHAHTIGALPVSGDHGLVGVFGERDLVAAVSRHEDLDTELVAHHLSTPVLTSRPDDTVLDVALQMLDSGARHLPVVDDLGHAQGMVSLRDLLRPLVLQAMTPRAASDRG